MSPRNASSVPVFRELASDIAAPSGRDDDPASDPVLPIPETIGPRQSPGKTSPDLDTTGPHQRE